MPEFVANSSFMPELERVITRAMDDLREEMYQDVKRNISPSAVEPKATVRTTPAKKVSTNQIGVFIGYGRGLGPIFESGTQQRLTKGRGRKRKYGAGINRGRISTANHAMKNAKDKALRRGLDLRRYL